MTSEIIHLNCIYISTVVKKITEINTLYIKDTSGYWVLIQQRHTDNAVKSDSKIEENNANPIVIETGLGIVILTRLA